MVPYFYTRTEEYGIWSPILIPVQRSMVHGPLFIYLYRGVWFMVPYSYTTVQRSMVHGPLFLYLYRGVWYMVPYCYTTVQRSMVHGPLFLYLYRGVWYMVPYSYVYLYRGVWYCTYMCTEGLCTFTSWLVPTIFQSKCLIGHFLACGGKSQSCFKSLYCVVRDLCCVTEKNDEM